MSNMIRKSMDPKGLHKSPLGEGKIDMGANGIKVGMLYYPEEKAFKQMVYKATLATRGSSMDDTDFDPKVVEEAFAGGLNQCLEWVTVVFEISGVSRGLTHELVRTRQASFAQQSMRHTDMGVANVRMPEEISKSDLHARMFWFDSIIQAREAYMKLVDRDIPFQDARTVLPLATETYIIASYPLKVFLDTYSYRACYMFYPEIVSLFQMMKSALVGACPWLEPYILISCEKTRPNGDHPHMCTYQGWERVEGHCPFSYAKEDNRVWKSTKFEN